MRTIRIDGMDAKIGENLRAARLEQRSRRIVSALFWAALALFAGTVVYAVEVARALETI